MRNSILFVLVVASLESGCGAKLPSMKPFKMEVQQGNVVTSKMLLQLRPGMTRSQVRYIMGTPLIVDSFRDNRWDYFYALRKQGAVVEQRRVILDFEKDSLVSVRGDVIPSAGNPEVKTIAEAPAKKIEADKDQAWTDKLKFWKSEEGADTSAAKAPGKPEAPAAAVNAPAPEAAKPASATPAVEPSAPAAVAAAQPAVAASTQEEVVPYIPEGEYAEAAKVAGSVEPPASFQPAPVAAPEPVLPPVSATGASQPATVAAVTAATVAATAKPASNKKAPVAKSVAKPAKAEKSVTQPVATPATPSAPAAAAVVDDEVIPFIPEGEYVAPVVPSEQEMVSGNMAEANQPTVDAQAHQVTEKGVAPTSEIAATPPPTFITEQLPEPEPEPALPPPPPPVASKSVTKPVPPVVVEPKAAVAAAPTAPVVDAARVATPVVIAEEALADDAGVQQALAGWAQAWRSKNVKNYLAAYAPDFVPEALSSRKAWETQRKQRLSSAQGAITLVLNNVQVQRDGTTALVEFEQKYAAKTYRDTLNKTLEMRYEPSQKRWLITRERTQAAVASLPAAAASVDAAPADVATADTTVDAAVQAWAQAWRSKNINAYFAAYSPAFVPEGLPGRAAWEAQRKKRLSPQQGKISLELSNLNVSRDGDTAVVTFTQKYASKSYSDEMVKRLELKQDATTQRWQIVRESAASGADVPAAHQEITAPEGSAEHLDGVLEQIGF